jgi:hypothetical protein
MFLRGAAEVGAEVAFEPGTQLCKVTTMLISIEDYLNRRRASQVHARPLRVAAGGTAAALSSNPSAEPRPCARVHVLPLVAPCYDPALPSPIELGSVYAEATLL